MVESGRPLGMKDEVSGPKILKWTVQTPKSEWSIEHELPSRNMSTSMQITVQFDLRPFTFGPSCGGKIKTGLSYNLFRATWGSHCAHE